MASEGESDEIVALQQEFEWLLHEEVNTILEQLQGIILECARRFPLKDMPPGTESLVKGEKFLMTNSGTSQQDQIKVVATLCGDNISHADINLRLHKHPAPNHRAIVQNDCQWKLQQLQDAGNHLMAALQLLTSPALGFQNGRYEFKSAEEVIHMANGVMGCLQRGRSCLVVPKRRTIEELQSSRNIKSLQPPLPTDIAVSFYIQSHKLVFAVYYIHRDQHGHMKFDVFQAESSVPWLSEVLVLFTVALQLCQQLKDKVSVFTQYKDMHKCEMPATSEHTLITATGP